jgi:GT2 family glycosyltransferase
MWRVSSPQAELIVSPANSGYSSGNNIGLGAFGSRMWRRTSRCPVMLLLNLTPKIAIFLPDGRIYGCSTRDRRCRPKLVLPEAASIKPAAGADAGGPLYTSGVGELFPNSLRFARYNMSFLDPEQAEVDLVVGAFMTVRREAIVSVGLLDETFFMYGEDIDWAYRIQKRAENRLSSAGDGQHVKRVASHQSQRAKFEFWRAMLIFTASAIERRHPGCTA